MPSVSLDPRTRTLTLAWPDGRTRRFPYLWLRDNEPAAFHPDTAERVRDLMDIAPDCAPAAARIEGDALLLDWPGESAPARLPIDWLEGAAPRHPLPDPADVPPVAWDGTLGAGGVKRAEARPLLEDDAALAEWMRATTATGLSIVTGLADDKEAGMEIARRAGFLRRTNFGVTFDVRSRPNPNNLAYTAEALPLHTDLPNQELPPGYQFLHCLVNEAEGGGSVFADGVALAEAVRTADPEAFARLATTPIPFRFHDADCDIRARKPVIVTTADGSVSEICWNAHIAGVLDLPPEEIEPYYAAYRAFMALTRDPAWQITLKLASGEMAVFDNRRVLHGRAAFDPATGARHLRGCYVDRGEWASRLRVLARSVPGAPGLAAE